MSPRGAILLVAGGAAAALFAPHAPRLVWNATASAPIGLYRLLPIRDFGRGDLVLAKPPHWVRPLAAKRGYLPFNVPLVKCIAALAGDKICADGNRIVINGHIAALRQERDASHRPLPHWSGCQILRPDEVFLLMADVPSSFDGRYFGPVSRHAVLGKLRPLWIW
ncbi:conjugative transfer signal peptidase TraF [Rhizomicrobium palustre]|uniref:Conjugative transfer signal peptidase TraF n=1 Tax=Rhizomicrobium palustre TaxID=189966 RepID=A0A846MW11_9PROT|nr:S26 family signal peptidase [Rhizomicrobium palustre]NIK87566.1 conjugative transfer signal peptidase TraF [Rhizomicrobium palustre]